MARRRRRHTAPTPTPAADDRARADRTREIHDVVKQAMHQLYGKNEPRPARVEQKTPRQLKAVKSVRPAKVAPKPAPAPKPAKEEKAAPPVFRAEPTHAPRGHLGAPRGNFAFIDGTNLNVSIRHMGWSLDWKLFRELLRADFGVTKAYYFLGYLEANEEIYDSLRGAGFELVFKPTLITRDGSVKGNVDAELVLQAMIDLTAYDRAVIVTGDGDFASLINHLRRIGKLAVVLIPNSKRYSTLIKNEAQDDLAFIDRLRAKLAYKAPKGS